MTEVYEQHKVVMAVERVGLDLRRGAGEPIERLPFVGLKELVRVFGVGETTPYQWKGRNQLPPHDLMFSGQPVWRLPTIYVWAEETNRKIKWDPWDVVAPSDQDRWGMDADPIDPSRPVGAVA